MSHIAKIELEIKDITALKNACDRLGLQFMQDQKTYQWYGRWVGDTPLPEGVNINDLGKCDHAIRAPGCNYEVGVVKSGTGYSLMWDYWRTGGLTTKIGQKGGLLKQAYTIERSKIEARRKGYRVAEQRVGNKLQLRVMVQ